MVEWEEKAEAYEKVFEQGRQAKDLWQYIPQRVMAGVTDAYADSDGYWIQLDHEEGGWTAYDGAEDCGVIHEYSIADLRKAIRTIRCTKKEETK